MKKKTSIALEEATLARLSADAKVLGTSMSYLLDTAYWEYRARLQREGRLPVGTIGEAMPRAAANEREEP